MKKIAIDEDCFVCGDAMTLYTEAKQSGRVGDWTALDGDRVACYGCGFEAYVSVDEEGAHVTWDETTPHNMAVAARYKAIAERREGMNCERHEMDVPPGCPGCILDLLKNLLAVIHGDGGHHTEWVGIPQSAKDATDKVVSLKSK